MSIQVREFDLVDLDAIEALLESLDVFTEDERDEALMLIEDSVYLDSEYETLVAEEDDAVIGFIVFSRTPMTQDTFDLNWIATDPAMLRRGVGKALLGAMIDAIGHGLVRVETGTRHGHEPAIAFYRANGFDEMPPVHDFYGPGDDLITFFRRYFSCLN